MTLPNESTPMEALITLGSKLIASWDDGKVELNHNPDIYSIVWRGMVIGTIVELGRRGHVAGCSVESALRLMLNEDLAALLRAACDQIPF